MGAKNIIRLWTAGLKAAPQLDLASGETLVLKPNVDNQGSLEIGDGTTDMDLKIFLGATGDIATFDNDAGHLIFDNAEINMGDNDEIEFGDGPDIQMQWNATYMQSGPVSGMWSTCPSAINPDPNVFSCYYDDFFSADVAITNLANTPWNLDTAATAGTAVQGNAADSNTPGNGFIQCTTGATDNDFIFVHLAEVATGAGWNFVASGLSTWFEIGFIVDRVTDCSMYVGMFGEGDIKPFTDNSGIESIADGIYFRTLTATPTEIDFCTNQGGTEIIVGENGGTIAANTAIRLGFHTDGTTLTPYFNGVAGTTDAQADGPTDAALTPGFGILSGTTNVCTIFVDYVKIVQMRA